jgi:hypothetical protein
MKQSPIKPKLISPKKKIESYENKKYISPIKPKLISPLPTKRKRVSFKHIKSPTQSPILKTEISPTKTTNLKSTVSPTKSPKNTSVDDKPYIVKYRTVSVKTILNNYEYPKKFIITEKRFRVISKYINYYSHLDNQYDALILASLSQDIVLC